MTELAGYKLTDSVTGQGCRIISKWMMDNGILAASIILDDGTFMNVQQSELKLVKEPEPLIHIHDQSCEWHFGRCYSE